ncbi:mannose-6-phosphate isomerase-like protein (cupin superfamily) [Rhizobium aethiopicum]|uniref:Mannose-6-phosphate isomerase-like protein (Cupin superfamily) n=1 Tax=Rhizobium aethiopicum TaxID=1138170 RepID=A0A7W6MI81_9HYPH|nr:cupin domain-containing protein [Rhizobium aethiopicum]MBB4192849.1 mannose-6-phosphate isomerase-like protein (cupin superfamily) [Rhizobium aethiopicum]MBB4581642.1 mannose-6-phosphate isomerase-like protein (cupin superfamily) [Rhizobium aethiopicum]
MEKFDHAAVSPPAHGMAVMAFGKHVLRIMAENTGGSLGMFEACVLPGEGPPLHVHEREDELFRVLSGRFGFWCAGDYVELTEGGSIALPRGVPHRFRNVGQTEGRLMVIVTPGGFESFFPIVELCKPETPEQIASIARGFGLTFPPEDDRKVA